MAPDLLQSVYYCTCCCSLTNEGGSGLDGLREEFICLSLEMSKSSFFYRSFRWLRNLEAFLSKCYYTMRYFGRVSCEFLSP